MHQGNMRDGRPSRALGLAAMLKKTLRTNYRRKLAHIVALADGTELITLRDAANTLLDVLDSVNARSGVPDHGKRADIAAATDSIERLLRDRRLL
jgi:hypothetical protein